MSSSKFISRRQFGGLLAAATLSAAGAVRAGSISAPGGRSLKHHSHAASVPKPIKPARLREGDLVGICAPSGHINEGAITRAILNMQSLGLHVRLSDNLRAVNGNYAGTVQQRLDDLHAMFRDPDIKAVWPIRGGSGAISLLSAIDYALIKANPKILIGFSDITALHLAIHARTGLVTFHGPVASSVFTDYAVAQIRAVLMEPQARCVIPMSEENFLKSKEEPQYAIRTVHGGQASGRLIGGNLSLVSALVGTPYAANFRGSILFLEEVNEAPYRIDRMLNQLQLSQGLEHAAALMFGICEGCGAPDNDPSLTLDETLDQHLLPLRAAAVSGYSFGHIRDQCTLPVGVMASLDTQQHTITLLEAAVL
ncbi:MAG TPA: LD-carboxypeptidase [Janthinobacterium sp.]|jgi:muramoyltetrapeptide carboxypeptidase|nr:LD-carboxypeptidase [Janthinobacterium sp.]